MKSQIICFGVDHNTAPLPVRERLTLTGDGLRLALIRLRENFTEGVSEAAILSTCNRLEIYLVVEKAGEAREQFMTFIRDTYSMLPENVQEYSFQLANDQAIQHIMRVAAGLESMVLGEPQILGQVSQAITKALNQQSAGLILHHLFVQAVRAGKRARTETDISRHTTSISHAAAAFAKERLGDLQQAKILIIGAGEMAIQAALTLSQHGAKHFTCLSRTLSHAQALVAPLNGQTASWLELPDELECADLVISAVSAPHVILSVANITPILPRRNRRLVMVDIGVPRNIEVSVAKLPGVDLYDMDNLKSVVDEHLVLRQAAIPQVETIIEEEASTFNAWLRSRSITPTLVALRHKTETIASVEVDKTLCSLDGISLETRKAVIQLGQRIAQKFLHDPTICIKAHAQTEDYLIYTETVRNLFALGPAGMDGLDE